jgi:hypothetical protein
VARSSTTNLQTRHFNSFCWTSSTTMTKNGSTARCPHAAHSGAKRTRTATSLKKPWTASALFDSAFKLCDQCDHIRTCIRRITSSRLGLWHCINLETRSRNSGITNRAGSVLTANACPGATCSGRESLTPESKSALGLMRKSSSRDASSLSPVRCSATHVCRIVSPLYLTS